MASLLTVRRRGAWAAIAVLALAACRTKVVPDEQQEAYAPGLGEIMGLNQVRHAKLWFAGRAANWALASYELDELGEGFADAAKYHPVHKSAPDSIGRLIPAFTDQPIAALRQVVARHDSAAFPAAFDALTAGCNGCHAASGFGFNVVQRPTAPPFSNQSFTPPPPSRAAPGRTAR